MRKVSQRTFLQGLLLLLFFNVSAQDLPQSIHYEQNEYYKQFGEKPAAFYDSLERLGTQVVEATRSNCHLQRIVFGFHPYWAGSDYLNYQWNLLSDLCYFSYEVNSSDGSPLTIHDWLSDPVIDSAKAHGVKVHLCATIFSGHTAFFTNPASRQNLINNLVSLVQQRNADGVNMDIEALPSSLSDSVTSFMRDLSVQLKAVMPQAKVSIDLPAVNWGNDFDIPGLDPYVDLFFVMGYDYYYNGSQEAGPVSPLYSLTSGFNYSISRTISDYQSSGLRLDKFVLGIPYYGRKWKTASGSIPSETLANGTALTYANIRSNSSNYNPSNYHWDNNSFSSCYIYFQNDNWNQCFIGLDRDARKWYDIVNYRDLGGIGIWALGYDNGYPDLWQAISDKFSDCYIPLVYDTIFDSGGPAWNYYAFEDYLMTIDHGFNDLRYLSFSGLNLENGYDSLWIYAGSDTTFNFLGGYTGQTVPGTFTSDNGAFTLRFRSDGLNNALGWMAVYHNGSLGTDNGPFDAAVDILVYPNPANHIVNIVLPARDDSETLMVYDFTGRVIVKREFKKCPESEILSYNIMDWPVGVYSIILINNSGYRRSMRLIKV